MWKAYWTEQRVNILELSVNDRCRCAAGEKIIEWNQIKSNQTQSYHQRVYTLWHEIPSEKRPHRCVFHTHTHTIFVWEHRSVSEISFLCISRLHLLDDGWLNVNSYCLLFSLVHRFVDVAFLWAVRVCSSSKWVLMWYPNTTTMGQKQVCGLKRTIANKSECAKWNLGYFI